MFVDSMFTSPQLRLTQRLVLLRPPARPITTTETRNRSPSSDLRGCWPQQFSTIPELMLQNARVRKGEN